MDLRIPIIQFYPLFFLPNSYVHICFSLLSTVQLPYQALFSTTRQNAWHLLRFSTCLLQLLNGLYSFFKSHLLTVIIGMNPIQICLILFSRYYLLPSHFNLGQVHILIQVRFLFLRTIFQQIGFFISTTYIQFSIYFMWDGIA